MQIKSLIKNTVLTLSLTGLMFSNAVVAFAQNAPTLPNLPGGLPTPGNTNTNTGITSSTFGSIPTESPTFGIDITTCFAVFDWERYMENLKNGRQSNPYIDKDCVRQTDLVKNEVVQKRFYKDFQIGSQETKQALGNIPVVGIFPNQGYEAQGIVNKTLQQINPSFNNVDRSKLSSLTNIFTQEDLKQIYSTTNGQFTTGIPRMFHTGPDEFRTDANGREIYQGGWCKAENGKIMVRDKQVNRPLADNYFRFLGVDKSNATATCALPGETAVKDKNLEVYQFLWQIPYPTGQQCQKWFGVNEADCKRFYRITLGEQLAGDTNLADGESLVYAYTFYGSFDDKYTKWVRWATPDVGNRQGATDATIASFNGYNAFEMK